MPGLIMERPKMSLQMHENLKRYILRERKKKKEEDVANEQKMREEMRKAEMNTQTLEQTKEQIKQLETKLEELQNKKRDLFSQLKKVLNEENNLKKRPVSNQNEPVMFPPASYPAVVFPSTPIRFLPPTNRVTLFKPETLMQPQPIKRQRSPSPTPPPVPTPGLSGPPNQSAIFQSPQHQNILPPSNQNSIAGLSTVTNTQAVFQPHLFSPNKKPRVTAPPNASPSPLTTINTFPSVVVGQPQPQRLQSPYNGPQQSAFSAYPSHFISSLSQQQQSQQQKPTLLGVPGSPVHAPAPSLPYGIPPRLHQSGIPLTSQLDPNAQKMLLSQQLLISHPQSGGILAGFPLQRPTQSQPPQHPSQPPYQ